MSLKRLTEQKPAPTPPTAPAPAPTGRLDIRQARFTDGFNFGLGFFAAAFVFSFVIVPTIICLGALALTVVGGSLAGLGGG